VAEGNVGQVVEERVGARDGGRRGLKGREEKRRRRN
jgi:hypothetical protein